VARPIENLLCFGVYYDGLQVGFARVISDYATYAYIGDVFVLQAYQRRGLGKLLMERIMQDPRLQGLRRWSLVTRDAHGLYQEFGFTPLKSPEGTWSGTTRTSTLVPALKAEGQEPNHEK
jgi:GNAT superfamily N-acetyltransferase